MQQGTDTGGNGRLGQLHIADVRRDEMHLPRKGQGVLICGAGVLHQAQVQQSRHPVNQSGAADPHWG